MVVEGGTKKGLNVSLKSNCTIILVLGYLYKCELYIFLICYRWNIRQSYLE